MPANKAWREKNREKYLSQKREWARRWRLKNPEEKKRRDKANYEKNRERILERVRNAEWALRNPEARKKTLRKYWQANKFKWREQRSIRRARERNAEGQYTESDVAALYDKQSGLCGRCRRFLSSFHVDHVVPLSRGGSNWPANLQLLCVLCNLSKGAR